MIGYAGVSLNDILKDKNFGEDAAKRILSSFSCPLNPDVESFLKTSAIPFSNQGIAAVHLIFASYKSQNVLVGYFALANKVFCIDKNAIPSSSWKRRLNRFAQFDQKIKRHTISAPLIGQLGKNYANGYDKLITGDELLLLALNKVRMMQAIVGGKIVYLECEDKEPLLRFYSDNGFVNFGKRMLDKDETDLNGEYLIQMLKYLN